MKTQLFSMVVVVAAVIFLSACASLSGINVPFGSVASSHGGEVEDQAGLLDALRATGAEVEVGDEVEQPFFSVKGQVVKVNGMDVQLFEYESAEAMEADAAQVAPDGSSIGTSMVAWIDAPHFFKQGRVLALYIGRDEAMLNQLEEVLGGQFAGK